MGDLWLLADIACIAQNAFVANLVHRMRSACFQLLEVVNHFFAKVKPLNCASKAMLGQDRLNTSP
jgi:hypothetical protein